MQLTSSPRRALGLVAASTIGLSTALLGVTSVAQAADVPYAPEIVAVEGWDKTLDVFFDPNHPADDADVTPWAETWEYNLDGSGFEAVEVDFDSGYGHFQLDGLTNGTEYEVVVRGIAEDTAQGTPSAPVSGTPYLPIGAPGTPVVEVAGAELKISWTAPTTDGTFDLAGYEVTGYVDAGESGGPTELCTTGAGELSCTAKVTPGWKYVAVVSAFDTEDNYGEESAAAASVTIPALGVPATVPTKHADLTLPAGAKSTVVAGKTITVTGAGYQPGSTVTLAIYSTPQVLTTVVADGSGNFTATVTVPAGLAAGTHTLVAAGVDGAGNPRYVTLAVTVSAAGTATVTGPKLANTGADVTVPALGGIATLGLGASLIALSRRRRTAA